MIRTSVKHNKLYKILILFISVLMVVGTTAMSFEAANGDVKLNTGHNPNEYCWEASDVSIKLSEIEGIDRAELENTIIADAEYKIMLYGNHEVLEDNERDELLDKAEKDFSQLPSYEALKTGVNPDGYKISITLPARNANVTQTSFTVHVVDDIVDISYEFVSGTEGKTLPADLKAPDQEHYAVGTMIKPTVDFDDVKADGGTWKFAGWEPSDPEVEASTDMTFIGTWTWTKDQSKVDNQNPPTSKPSNPSASKNTALRTSPKVMTITEYEPQVSDDIVTASDTPDVIEPIQPKSPSKPAYGHDAGSINMQNMILVAMLLVMCGVMTALISSILSDFRVLRWYNQKKAEFRRR